MSDHAVDPPDGDVVFSYMVRQRIREATAETHSLVVERLRQATRQGGAASPSGLAAEVRAISAAMAGARTSHGAQKARALLDVRAAYLAVAVSCIILAERATRPDELPRGSKSQTTKYRSPRFGVPRG